MVNQPKTPHRTVRIEGGLWSQAQTKAAWEARTVSDVIREGLEEYVARRLCVHADDGQPMHWLEPGEKCPLTPPTHA